MTQSINKEELIIKKFRNLSSKKQQELLDFADCLEDKNRNLTANKEEEFFALAGIWENREITIENLRKEAWK